MHTFPPSVTFSPITKVGLSRCYKRSSHIASVNSVNKTIRTVFSTFLAVVPLRQWEGWEWLRGVCLILYTALLISLAWLTADITAKKTHAPDCMPPLMGKPFSAESCGKAVHFLFSRRVVNSTFFGGPSVSLLKGFVMAFLQSGYASDQCVQLKELLGFYGNNNWSAR